jgi:micrococcal nuclease
MLSQIIGRFVVARIRSLVLLLCVLLVVGCADSNTTTPPSTGQRLAVDVDATSTAAPSRTTTATSKPADTPAPTHTDVPAAAAKPQATPPPTATATVPAGVPTTAEVWTVVEIVDGDTFIATDGVHHESITLAGIDAPEPGQAGDGGECYGSEATERLTRMLPNGRTVWLTRAGANQGRDGLLRAVWIVGDNGSRSLVNESLVRRGFAAVTAAGEEGTLTDRLIPAQRMASNEGAGLWGTCSGPNQLLPTATPRPTRTPVPTETPSPTRTAVSPPPPTETFNEPACDPNYTGACVPPYPPDVNCPSLPDNFERVGADPHDLDRDNDGIACEA